MPDKNQQHNITLDLITPVSVEAIYINGGNTASATHSIVARITSGRKTADLKIYKKAQLKIERLSDYITGTISDSGDYVTFSSLAIESGSKKDYVKDGWNLASVILTSVDENNKEREHETQQFQIYKESFVSRKIDTESLEKLDDNAIRKISDMVASYDDIYGLVNDKSSIDTLVSMQKDGTIDSTVAKANSSDIKLNGITEDSTSGVHEKALKKVVINFNEDDYQTSYDSDGVASVTMPTISINNKKIETTSNDINIKSVESIKTKKGSSETEQVKNGNVVIKLQDVLNKVTVNDENGNPIYETDSFGTKHDNILGANQTGVVDAQGNVNINVPVGDKNTIETISVRGTKIDTDVDETTGESTKNINLDVMTSFDVGVYSEDGSIDASSVKHNETVVFKEGNAINISRSSTPGLEILEVSCDTGDLYIDPSNINDNGAISDHVLGCNNKGEKGWYNLTELGILDNINTYAPSYNFNFNSFIPVEDINSTDFIPFVEMKDIDDDEEFDDKYNPDIGINKKITWENLMKLFYKNHRTEYIDVVIPGSSWADNTAIVKMSVPELSRYNVTVDELVNDEHNHVHVHPSTTNVMEYCNNGIYCYDIYFDSQDSTVAFAFHANKSDNIGNIQVIFEVRIG